jgi:hypothetical protein
VLLARYVKTVVDVQRKYRITRSLVIKLCSVLNTYTCSYLLYLSQYSSAVTVSLDEPLSGVTYGLPLPNGLEGKPAAQVSTLKNGLKVASFETYAPVATVGLVVGMELAPVYLILFLFNISCFDTVFLR